MSKRPRSENAPTQRDVASTGGRSPDMRSPSHHQLVIAAVLGATFVVISVFLFDGDQDLLQATSVVLGLVILLATIWFAAHPFVSSSRRFGHLRGEVDEFIDLVRALHAQVLGRARPEDIENTTAELHEAVERIVLVCDEPS